MRTKGRTGFGGGGKRVALNGADPGASRASWGAETPEVGEMVEEEPNAAQRAAFGSDFHGDAVQLGFFFYIFDFPQLGIRCQ